jgi:cytochrome c oxidase subunit 1
MAAVDHTLTGARPAAERLSFMEQLHEWVVTVDHKRLGVMYIGSGLFFFFVAGLEASLMRLQLAVPNNTVLSPQVFNRLFTMHGTTMLPVRHASHHRHAN